MTAASNDGSAPLVLLQMLLIRLVILELVDFELFLLFNLSLWMFSRFTCWVKKKRDVRTIVQIENDFGYIALSYSLQLFP